MLKTPWQTQSLDLFVLKKQKLKLIDRNFTSFNIIMGVPLIQKAVGILLLLLLPCKKVFITYVYLIELLSLGRKKTRSLP